MPSGDSGKQGPVLRNTLILIGAQVLGMPLSIALNALMGRHLGASDFGYAYLATTFASLGFLFVEWGHGGVLPAAVARDHSRAGVLLGSSIVWRLGAATVVTMALSLGCWAAGYPPIFQTVLAIVAVQFLFVALGTAYQDVVRGFERADVAAIGRFGLPLLLALFVVPVLLLGGKLQAVVLAQALASAVLLLFVWRASRHVGIGKVSFDKQELKGLTRAGWPFLVSTIAMTLQGSVDALALSKLASPEVVGWHAAAQRLTGVLLVPSSALIASLYPTLSRLIVEDIAQFRQTTRKAIEATALVAIPLALGCAFYRKLGVSLYSQKAFGPAEQNLLVLSVMLFLIYFTMPLGSAILAAGRHRAWAWTQAGCVVIRLILNPLLVPWFQEHYGNGGLGVCVAAVVSELLVVATTLFLTPKGVLDRTLAKTLAKAAAAGGVMAAVAFGLAGISPYLAAPIAMSAYAAALWLVGGLDKSQLAQVAQAIARKLSRRRPTA